MDNLPHHEPSQHPLTTTTDLPSDIQYDHDLGFALDIDGTLVLSHQEIPGSSEALNTLTRNNIPYILVTNNISKS